MPSFFKKREEIASVMQKNAKKFQKNLDKRKNMRYNNHRFEKNRPIFEKGKDPRHMKNVFSFTAYFFYGSFYYFWNCNLCCNERENRK